MTLPKSIFGQFKCKCVLISRKRISYNVPVQPYPLTKYGGCAELDINLGVVILSDLSWIPHIQLYSLYERKKDSRATLPKCY